MAFRIEYYRAGIKIGAFPCPKSRSATVEVAKAGLKRFDADAARILDMDAGGVEVESVKR